MFKIVKELTAWWPVKVYEPDPENPGKFAMNEFEAEFLILDRDQVRKNIEIRQGILDEMRDAKKDSEVRAAQDKMDAQLEKEVQSVVRNWRNIVDENGVVFPFTNENLLFLHNRDTTRDAFNVAYTEAIDSEKAREKN